ncbi:MAG: Fe-S protein assembly co-chaperone HscB [Thiohalomonadaceae bacterium]
MNEDYFQLFALAQDFSLDTESLAARYRDLQRAAHPDRYAGAGEHERLLAVQQAARINEAYQTLKDPLKRMQYMLSLHGIALPETDTRMDAQFLMTQMELRESLESATQASDPYAVLAQIRATAEQTEQQLLAEVKSLFQQGGQMLQDIPARLHKLQFMRKLLEEVDAQEDELVDED